MNELHRLIIDEIEVGEKIPWDIVDKFGQLLLIEGSMIKSREQALEMIDSGSYIEKGLYTKLPTYKRRGSTSSAEGDQSSVEVPSVLHTINLAVKRLDVLLKNIQKFPDARKSILEIVKLVHKAVQLSEDLALASMQLNHNSGSYPVRHCVDTAILAMIVAKTMKKTDKEIQDIAAAALTMNISMIFIQERLQVQKEVISTADKEAIHNHPIASIETLYDAGIEDSDWLMYVLLHHEHEDGTGYPVGTVKGEIPQNAKILTLADGFCARITSRGYRKSTLPNTALRDIFIENSTHVDAALGAYFVKVLGLYPPGTFVQLQNKEIAIVSQRGTSHSHCIVHSMVKPNGELFGAPIKRDTSMENYKIAEAILPIDADVHVNLQQIWGPLASL